MSGNPTEKAVASAPGRRLFIFNRSQEALPNLTGFLASVDPFPDSGLLVVSNDRCGLLVVGDESLLESFGVVVGSLNQRLASNIILHIFLWGIENFVI